MRKTAITEIADPVAKSPRLAYEYRKGDRNESQTVLRACEVLKAFRTHGEELVLADVVHRTQLPKTTVFRLLRTLIHGGLLERSGDPERYEDEIIPLALSILQKKPAPATLFVKHQLITSRNVDLIYPLDK